LSKKSIRGEKTPPRKSKTTRQMVDFKGLPLSTEQGYPLISERDSYNITEYGKDYSTSVVVNSESYQQEALSTQNKFSKGGPAALPVKEIFPVETEVSRSLLGINRETTQVGLFENVSSYGLDVKDWKIDLFDEQARRSPRWWYEKPNVSGNHFESKYVEDSSNAAIGLLSNPVPFSVPPSLSRLSDLPTNPPSISGNDDQVRDWARYLNSVIALYLVKYMVKNFNTAQKALFNVDYLLSQYPPIIQPDSSIIFNDLYWDQVWLDISQNRLDPKKLPVLPSGTIYNYNPTNGLQVAITVANESLWGAQGVVIPQASSSLPSTLPCGWNSFLFSLTRVFYPSNTPSDKGHYLIKTTPDANVWEKYFGLRYDLLRQDLKDWEFTVHPDNSSVTQMEIDLKLPYFVLSSTSPTPDKNNNTFTPQWPALEILSSIDLPINENRPGGRASINAQVAMSSKKPFRYQPGRISGFTYGVKVSEIGAGPGTTIEWGIENDTDAYLFRLEDGGRFSIVRKSTIPLDNTLFLENTGYEDNTKAITSSTGQTQYETIVDQKIMNGDPLNGAGKSGYIIDLDTVTMYKIEFGWYGAIGARFYAYIPVKNGESRWVTLHTFVIENQLEKPCLADPFFFFKYRLYISNSSTVRLPQSIYKFGASYYIDGADEGTLYLKSAKSKERLLSDPKFSVSKTGLNAVDWTVLTGIKPLQFLTNRNGNNIYNKKQIFPASFSIYSQQDCEIKIIRQRGCPEFAYMNQEGYKWEILPPSRRLKGRFTVNPLDNDEPDLDIELANPSTHTAVLTYNSASTGYRDIADQNNWSDIIETYPRIVGDDLFALLVNKKSFGSGGGLSISLGRLDREFVYFSSLERELEPKTIALPFTYPQIPPYSSGYDVEIDYYRRDQILLSSVNIFSEEFYIYWTNADLYGSQESIAIQEGKGIDNVHRSSIRFGFAWPSKNVTSKLSSEISPNEWGLETPSAPGEFVDYDNSKFYEGLPVDFATEYQENSLYVEATPLVIRNPQALEVTESYLYRMFDLYNLEAPSLLSVPGEEGGLCRGLGCRVNPVVVEDAIIANRSGTFYIERSDTGWRRLPEDYLVTLIQSSTVVDVITNGPPEERPILDPSGAQVSITYGLPIGNTLPSGINQGPVRVEYSEVEIASLDYSSTVRTILADKIAPGRVPFFRVWVQGRQGATLGGVWIGQKTSNGVLLDPFTPHRSTLSISDSGVDKHGEFAPSPPVGNDGAVKAITTISQEDSLNLSTTPTFNASESGLSTLKSIHTSPKKCGSFLSNVGESNSAGIFSPTNYPLRWLTIPSTGNILSTYYISAKTNTTIDLSDVFNSFKESVVNDANNSEATFFIARSLVNHTPQDSKKEIYMTLNYLEQ